MGKSQHWCRHVMDIKTKESLSKLDTDRFDALEISGRHWKKFRFKSYQNVHYPEFDITNISDRYKQQYDIVLAEQVFEHVRHPFRACTNVRDMLRPEGYLLITTPFFLRVHGAPNDYWRWTPAGLQAMLEDTGFQVEVIDSWGNRDCVIANLDHWEDYNDQGTVNDPDLPIVVWALAKKIS